VYLANRLGAGVDDHLVAEYIAVSRSTADLNGCRPPGGPNCEVVPNLLPLASVEPAEPHAVIPGLPDRPFVIYVGDLRLEKGVAVLFEAYRQGAGLPPLVVVGKQSPAETLELPAGVVRLGPMANSDVRALLGRAMLAVVPSVWPEPFSIVAIEAMAAGTPVIASSVGGLADVVVDGTGGLLVPPDDPEALRTAIRRLASDEALRTRLGRTAAEHAKRYRAELVVEEVEQMYSRALRVGR
jgi:glycosyltransferase involved in cell wall biosynthesis